MYGERKNPKQHGNGSTEHNRQKAGRSDLVEETKAEMAVLEKYMPKQLTADEIRQIVNDAVAGQSGLKMGDVMKLVMPKVKGKADGKLVSQIVREILQNN